jgi:methionyl-tRNA synthetase
MGKYADRLIEHIEKHPEFIQPVSRKNEMMNNFLKKGLQDLCVSRTSFKWGVPVEFDKKHVVYVWLDALTNYITGIGFKADGNHSEQYKKFWPADLHLIGKDILRFHTIYWPIFLMALGEPLPKQIFGHPWLLQGEGKMSKSKGNVIYADDLVRLYGVDAVRYFVLHEMPFESDGQITWELVTERFNTDLANVLGNLVSRTVAMITKYFGGTVTKSLTENEEAPDAEFKQTVALTAEKVKTKMSALRVADAISEIFTTLRRANKYIDETMPWALAKDESKKQRLNDVLYNLAEAVQICASLLDSFMPETASKMLAAFGGENRELDQLSVFGLANSVTVAPTQPLFARLDFKALEPEIEKIRAAQIASVAKAEEKPAEEKKEEVMEEKVPEITIDDFAKVQLRVGEIIACEKVPKSSKLLHETVKFGNEIRSVVSGIAKHYTPEEMVGKKVVFVTNLAPRTVCGVLSEGMILAAEDEDGTLSLITPDKAELKSGAKLG